MAEIATDPKTADKRLKNLRPWKKGEAPRPPSGGGRPRKQAWVDALNELAQQPKHKQALLMALLKKKPDVAMAYLAGKPVETVRLGGADDLPPIAIAEIEAASAIARRNRGMDGPSNPQEASKP